MFDPKEYTSHKGSLDDLQFRSATPEEVTRCQKMESVKAYSIPGAIFMIVVVAGIVLYVFNMSGISPVIRYGSLLFIVFAVINLIRVLIYARKSISYEVTDAELLSWSKVNNRVYVSAWCPREQIYIPKVRYLSSYHKSSGLPLLIVRGNRGEGKKPNYYAVSDGKDILENIVS